MKKIALSAAAALMMGGLAACSTDDNAAVDQDNNGARPIGYYTNENNRNARTAENDGNARVLDDNDGPLTEWMDRSFSNNGGRGYGVMQDGRTATGTENNHNYPTSIGGGRIHFSRSDENYHKHLNNNDATARSSYYRSYDGKLAEQLSRKAKKVKDVREARAIVNGENIILAVHSSGRSDKQVGRDVARAVARAAEGRNVKVVTDSASYYRIRNLDNDLRDGGPREQINADIDELFENYWRPDLNRTDR